LGFAFILKKLVSIFLMPLSIGMLLLTGGTFFLYRNKTLPARRFITMGILWLFLLSYAPFANLLLYQIEHHYPSLSHPPKGLEYIYVLGHGHTTDTTLPITSQLDKEAVVRLAEGIRLYHLTGDHAKLILSGYSGLFDPTPHAVMQQKLAQALGITQDDLILVPEAKDTQEEAEAAKRITQGEPLAVVSSAYHLPRALAFFKAEKLSVIPAPTFHQASLAHPNYLGIFSVDALKKSTIFFHELIGMLWQKIKGV
jgi:uncharacterized SAM-binding protein YcdF (DUF218 family)